MQTDWVLIGRLARELEERLRGSRVDDAGLLADGRVGIALRSRGARSLLAIDLFASAPLVTLEDGELGIGAEPGFVRTLARSLRSMIVENASARRNDRLLRLTFTARSRFGVGEHLELFLELVPRFGNIVLVKDSTIVAAYKEFAPSENSRRAVQVGSPYLLPPLPEHPRTLAVQPDGPALEYFARLRAEQTAQTGSRRAAQRREGMLKRLAQRQVKLEGELASLASKREEAQRREILRSQGDEIYATLHTLDANEREAAKERAAKLFVDYKKLAKSVPHIDERERDVRAGLEAVETLRWEAERASDDDLDGVETAVADLGPRRGKPSAIRPPKRKRALLEFRTLQGSRIVVGRSPVENAELTFRLARPGDLWFHAQRVPGAHVILARDDRTPAGDDEIVLAASLAAFHSRAKTAASVPVDYTLRKHVRKQRAAPPGLVWYTHAKTIVVEPWREARAERATIRS
ncbi:MAG: DUF814 domain-containing protein [Candidatus Eremiobacteraeota bacterium]|nr:DUF814 domain-containing protein [Candidatus Eremiobacteraeota bacterium]